MGHLHFTTKHINASKVKRAWYIVDVSDKSLGRISSRIASVLMGKNKPYFSNHVDCGDFIIVINAEKVKLTGNKMNNKKYIRHSNYPGGQKETTASILLEKKPTFIIQAAVKGMLPKNRIGRKMIKKMFVYKDNVHTHAAQKPSPLFL